MSDQECGRIRERLVGTPDEPRGLRGMMEMTAANRLARAYHRRFKYRRGRTAHLRDTLKRHPLAGSLFG